MSMMKVFELDHERCIRDFSTEFEWLVKKRRNDKIKSIVKIYSLSNVVDSYRRTLLHLAAKHNNTELINFSLNGGCDIDVKDSFGNTPLSVAYSHQQLGAVTVLLSENIRFDVNGIERRVRRTMALFRLSDCRLSLQRMFQFNLTRSERAFRRDFKELIKNRRNDDVKFILRNVSSANIVDSYGETLLHLAAKYNNLNLLNFLIISGCHIDAQNILEVTPLLIAAYNNHFEAMTILLTRNADFGIDDTNCIVRLLLTRKDDATSLITTAFLTTLRKHCVDLQAMALALVKANFPLRFVLRIRDACLTQAILETDNFNIMEEQCVVALQYAMQSLDFENLRVLWQSPHTVSPRRHVFRQLHYWITGSPLDWRFIKTLFKRFTDWISFDSDLTWFLQLIFRQSSRRVLEVLLLECNLDVQMRERYNFDVLPCIFANTHRDLIELVFERQFDVNSRSVNDMTALHFASSIADCNRVQLLLDLGADCNAKDNRGNIPITQVYNVHCTELLLQCGTDLQIQDNRGFTVIEKIDFFADTWQLMLAQLAIDQCRGVQVKRQVYRKIVSNQSYRIFYNNCVHQILEIMGFEIMPYLTLFQIIKENVVNIRKCIQDQRTIEAIMNYCRRESLLPYYCSSLRRKLEKVFNIFRARRRVAMIISRNLGFRIEYDHLLIDKIFDFLDYKDMESVLLMF